jgi:hypothetical protein
MPEKDRWIEIVISTPPQLVDALSNFLAESGARASSRKRFLKITGTSPMNRRKRKN